MPRECLLHNNEPASLAGLPCMGSGPGGQLGGYNPPEPDQNDEGTIAMAESTSVAGGASARNKSIARQQLQAVHAVVLALMKEAMASGVSPEETWVWFEHLGGDAADMMDAAWKAEGVAA